MWEVGQSVPSFTDATSTAGSAGTTDQPTGLQCGDSSNGTVELWVGKIIISDDITEDLSTWSPISGIAFPWIRA